MTAPIVFSRRKSLLFSAIIIGALLAAGEFAAGLLIKRFSETGTFDARAVENPFHPYTGWQAAPNYRVNTTKADGPKTVIETDADGRSITPLAYAAPRLTIAITGGSTMFGVGATGNATTVPSLLESKIRDRLGLEVEVVNLGVRGYTSFQEMLHLREWLVHHRADLVVAVSGRNDALAGRYASGLEYALLHEHVWRSAVPLVRAAEAQKPVILNPLGLIRRHSHLVDLIARVVLRLTGGNRPLDLADDGGARETGGELDTDKLADLSAAHYKMMDTLTRSHGGDFLFALQPTAYTLDRFPGDIPELLRNPERAQAEHRQENRFYDALRRRLDGLPALDLARALDGTPGLLYVDSCHYTDQGGDRLAEILLGHLTPRLQALAARR